MLTFDVILPTTTRGSLFAAIYTVTQQSYKNWKLWVIQDGTHASDMLIQAFPDPKIEFEFKQHEADDFGASARNFGIDRGMAQWIAYIDDDDEWLPNHLATLAELIEKNPNANMVRVAGQPFMMKHKSPRSSELVRKMGSVNSTDILTVGMAHTRDLFKQTTGWKPVDNHDHLLWREMLAAGGQPITCDAVTFHFRR